MSKTYYPENNLNTSVLYQRVIGGILFTSVLAWPSNNIITTTKNSGRYVMVNNNVENIIESFSPLCGMSEIKYHSFSKDCNTVVCDGDMFSNLYKLDRIKELKDNWDGDGANAFSSSLVECVKKIIMRLCVQPEVFPTACDSIQIEYEGEGDSYLEFEIYETDKCRCFRIDKDGSEDIFEMSLDLDSINRVVEEFYG